jgi:hypothetical protein
MQIIAPAFPFLFTYGDSFQNSSLYVAANVYNITTGSPVFTAQVPMTNIGAGVYSGQYLAVSGQTYLVVSVPYLDSMYTVLNPEGAPVAECYKSWDAPFSLLAFNYGAFDQAAGLYVAASIYNASTEVSFVEMPHVFAGVYFGTYTGTGTNPYKTKTLCYDPTFTYVDMTRSPGTENFNIFPTPINLQGGAFIRVGNLKANLVAM